ncbi:hypothetical protein HMPREF2097_02915 [Enterococcus faecalis 918]|nr:hypothetical protein HMPREF2097_02915 [Enterococcus faecalis 918]
MVSTKAVEPSKLKPLSARKSTTRWMIALEERRRLSSYLT